MARCRARPRRACCAASAMSSATHASSGLARSRWAPVQPARQRRLPRPARGADQTRATQAATIGVRKAPAPEGRAGFIRIDSVHQGDQDGTKGLYHINAVDCVTQWQVVATVQTISEAHLLPVIEQMPEQFPFAIIGFHADNGSEYVNHAVAACWTSCASSSPAAARGGTATTTAWPGPRTAPWCARSSATHIPQRHAARFNTYCREYLNPFLNPTDRVCSPPTSPTRTSPDASSACTAPRDAMTPLDKLASLPEANRQLREGTTLEGCTGSLGRSPMQAAEELNAARAALFRGCLHARLTQIEAAIGGRRCVAAMT